jgi:hypothetical protein
MMVARLGGGEAAVLHAYGSRRADAEQVQIVGAVNLWTQQHNRSDPVTPFGLVQW